MNQQWKRQLNRDWTYSEGCGCRITFRADANYKTSMMIPGEACQIHTPIAELPARNNFVERARQGLAEYLSLDIG